MSIPRRRRRRAKLPDHVRAHSFMAALSLLYGDMLVVRLGYNELITFLFTAERDENHAWN